MQAVNYSTLSLNNREQIFLKSVLIIHNGRSDCFWSENNSEFDVLIVGRDADQPIKIDAHVKAVLAFSTEIQQDHPHIYTLASPVKATELVEHFKSIESILKDPSTQTYAVSVVDTAISPSIELETSQKFRLLRWPRAELLAKDKTFTILAALLSKGAMSLDELVAISGKPKEICDTFLKMLISSDDIESIDIAVLATPQIEKKAPVQKSLLDKIRSRLGIFQK